MLNRDIRKKSITGREEAINGFVMPITFDLKEKGKSTGMTPPCQEPYFTFQP